MNSCDSLGNAADKTLIGASLIAYVGRQRPVLVDVLPDDLIRGQIKMLLWRFVDKIDRE
jgi:hypothetical protein